MKKIIIIAIAVCSIAFVAKAAETGLVGQIVLDYKEWVTTGSVKVYKIQDGEVSCYIAVSPQSNMLGLKENLDYKEKTGKTPPGPHQLLINQSISCIK